MSQQKIKTGGVVVLILLLGVAAFFVSKSDRENLEGENMEVMEQEENSSEANNQQTPPAGAPSEFVSADFVRVVNSLTKVAVFAFDVEVDVRTLHADNIRYCVLDEQSKTDPFTICLGRTTIEEGFALFYDDETNLLTIKDLREDIHAGTGRFNTGCVNCVSVIEFHNLKTKQGTPLPNKRVIVE